MHTHARKCTAHARRLRKPPPQNPGYAPVCIVCRSIENRGVSIEDRGVSIEDRGESIEDRGVSIEDRGVTIDRGSRCERIAV